MAGRPLRSTWKHKALVSLWMGREGTPRLLRRRPAKADGFVKSPSAALRCILRSLRRTSSTPHSSGLARLAYGAFYMAIPKKILRVH